MQLGDLLLQFRSGNNSNYISRILHSFKYNWKKATSLHKRSQQYKENVGMYGSVLVKEKY